MAAKKFGFAVLGVGNMGEDTGSVFRERKRKKHLFSYTSIYKYGTQ